MTNEKRAEAVIDLDALRHNIRSIREKIGGGKMICVVKADAYGHGAVECAKVMDESGADGFAVAVIDEAIELRNAGITKPILILGYTPKERMDDIVKYGITQTVYTKEMGEELSAAAVKAGKMAKAHIKLDTGMGRIGFRGNKQDIEDIKYIAGLKNVYVEGVFTHFSTADESDKAFTEIQLIRFKNIINELKKEGVEFDIIHCANSAGVMDFSDRFFNTVRPGIIQYGLYPSDYVDKESIDICPVMSLKSCISFIKTVNKGDTIGYGRTYSAPEERVIATIPVGYADGYLRSMQHGGRVIINGYYAPVVGRICMDQFMVDVTDIKDAKIGDEVTIMGKSGGLEITADEIADIMGTINYEVVCLVSRRVPRVYVEGGRELKEVRYI